MQSIRVVGGGPTIAGKASFAAAPLALAMVIIVHVTGCDDVRSPNPLQSRVEASFEVTARVTYQVGYDAAPQDLVPPNMVTATITQGPWGRRLDSFSDDAQTYSASFLEVGDDKYVCSRYTGLDPGTLPESQVEPWEDGLCYRDESPGEDEILGPLVDFTFSFREVLKESDGLEWNAISSRTIAGTHADCYQITFTDPETGQEDAEICFSSDDILLSVNMRSPDASGTFLALEVDRDVQEEDFALPYPIRERP